MFRVIITYILSLAVNFSPDEAAFVLIDYKGGGLADAFEKGVETAYKAVMKPKEGTILTVARGAAEKARELSDDGIEDLEEFFRKKCVIFHQGMPL